MEDIRPGPLPAREQPILAAPATSELSIVRQGRPDALVAALMALVHALAWAPVIVALLTYVPKYKKIFADFGMKLPWLTETLIDVSDAANDWLILVPVVYLLFVAMDGGTIYLMRRIARPLSWVWFVLLLLASFFSVFFIMTGVLAPMHELMEGLSK
jgi:hypothetical protein